MAVNNGSRPVPASSDSRQQNVGTGGQNPFPDSDVDNYDPPSAKFINWFLANADSRAVGALLHPIGFTDGSVAAGTHHHDGKDSPYLFDSTPVITALTVTATNAQIIAAIQALQNHLISRGAGQSGA
jgi:hypothetical protein